VIDEMWLFLSLDLLLYAAALASASHLLVIGYEEPRLQTQFGEEYDGYRRTVPIPQRLADCHGLCSIIKDPTWVVVHRA
jgi:hypothetical protein